jgi:hypothetical protein
MAEKITENKFADRICTARRHLLKTSDLSAPAAGKP